MGSQHVAIELTLEERTQLTDFTNKGSHPAKLIKRANVILALDSSYNRVPSKEVDISTMYSISRSGIHKIKDAWLESGIETIITRKKRETPPVERKIDGEVEAHIIALACMDPPQGYSRWTLRLLADKTVELGIIEDISYVSVGRVLKKTNLNLT